MSTTAEGLSFPYRPYRPLWRRILGPVIGWAFLTTALATLLRMALKPSMPRMSEQWLLSHQTEFNRLDD
jgi:hypothetical protein